MLKGASRNSITGINFDELLFLFELLKDQGFIEFENIFKVKELKYILMNKNIIDSKGPGKKTKKSPQPNVSKQLEQLQKDLYNSTFFEGENKKNKKVTVTKMFMGFTQLYYGVCGLAEITKYLKESEVTYHATFEYDGHASGDPSNPPLRNSFKKIKKEIKENYIAAVIQEHGQYQFNEIIGLNKSVDPKRKT